MKFLFIYPNIYVHTPVAVNHGIASLSACLKQSGHETNILIPRTLSNAGRKDILKQIGLLNPDVIGVCTFTNQWPYVKTMAEDIKKRYGLPIVIGGPHATLFPQCIEESPYIDGVCRGEGEYVLLEYLQAFAKGGNHLQIANFWLRSREEIVKNELQSLVQDLDELPLPDYDLFGREIILNYPAMMFSRGCPYTCTYCCVPALRKIYSGKGKFIRFKSMERITEEIRIYIKKFSPPYLAFDDDTFTKNKEWLKKFCKVYMSITKLPFHCNARPETLDRETLTMLKGANCARIGIGIESGDEEIREKVLNRKIPDAQIIHAIRCAKELGISVSVFVMIGIPGETPEKFQKTIKICQETLPDYIQLSIFYPFPGTSLGDLCKEESYIKGESPDFFTDTVLRLPNFSREEILREYRQFPFHVYKKVSLYRGIKEYIKAYLKQYRLILNSGRHIKKLVKSLTVRYNG